MNIAMCGNGPFKGQMLAKPGHRFEVTTRFTLNGSGRPGFEVGHYELQESLVHGGQVWWYKKGSTA